ncbi:MAG: PQQ-like beta-propeller repeat protein [Culturomica sp.]|jgi:outer membrane protein assembly factor BamB|nr:PQQ-like beta-propeller repeat protein [Culturomica sp.]
MKRTGILYLLLFAAQIVPAQNIEWRNDRTGIYRETGLLKSWPEGGPELLWHFDGLGQGYSSVSTGSGKLYITGMTDGTGYLYVLDMQGRLLNKKAYGKEWHISYQGTRGTVIPDDGYLYLVSGTGTLICFDASDLCVVWQKNAIDDFGGELPKYGMNESPLIVGDKLIFTPGGKEHNVVALHKKTGEPIWSSKAMGDIPSYCSPVYIGDQAIPQVVTMTGHHIVGIDISNGRLLWSVPFTNRFFEHPNTPVYGEGMLLCSSSYGVGSVMLRLTEGGKKVEEAWRTPDFDSRTGHAVKLGDYVYGAGDYGKGSWCCIEWKTGKVLYKDKTLPAGAVIAADGMLYCYTEKGDMALVRATPEKFDIIAKFPVTSGTEQHWAHPVIYKGILYIRHGDALMAYKIK